MKTQGERERRLRGPTGRYLGLAIAVLVLGASYIAVPGASAAPATLWQVPAAGPGSGSGAGEFRIPTGVAVDRATGNVLIADSGNQRIVEFSPWGVFLRAWGWGVADGAAQLETCGPAADPPTATCRAGLPGSGPGQFAARNPTALTIDSGGNVYALDFVNKRIEKFDSEGHFLLAWGEGGTGPGQFFGTMPEWPGGPYLAASPAGLIYVGDENRIQIFDSTGAYQGQIGLPSEEEVSGGRPEGKGLPGSLAFDQAGRLYFDFSPLGPFKREPIFRFNGSSWSLFAEVLSAEEKIGAPIATGVSGNVYVAGVSARPGGRGLTEQHIFEFDEAGAQLLPTKEEEEERQRAEEEERTPPPFFGEAPTLFTIPSLAASGNACRAPGEQAEDIYAAYYGRGELQRFKGLLRSYGPHPNSTLCPPPEAAPSITDQFVSAIDSHSATVKARINPHFWPTTTYFVQWGLGKCSEGGCTNEQPLPPGTPLGSESGSPTVTGGVPLSGLQPETTYHYRFVARTRFQGASEEEVEVRGVGGTVGSDGAEASFTTLPAGALPPRTNCPNQSFRTWIAARLSDCRAYEMVSPVDKAGGDIAVLKDNAGYRAGLDQSSLSGDSLTYSAFRAFGGAQASPYAVQYLAARGSGGWSTEAISPPRGRAASAPSKGLDSEFSAFSEDLCQGWLLLQFEPEPLLDPAAPSGFPNLYRRQNCGPSPAYEALTTVAPPDHPPLGYFAELQGISADGRCAVFAAPAALTPEAPHLYTEKLTEEITLYERCAGGPIRLVAVLPNGAASQTTSTAGTRNANQFEFAAGRSGTVYSALSADGSRVYWTPAKAQEAQLFLRLNADAPPTESGSCAAAESGRACTVAVSAASARFWAASADGSRAFYTEGNIDRGNGKLFEFNVVIEEGLPVTERTLIAEGAEGLMGASRDAKRIYFVSSTVLAAGATAAEPNLYYREAEQPPVFIGTLSAEDVPNELGLAEYAAITPRPVFRAARVSLDGRHAAFMSHAPLTGYVNTDQNSGEADAELFVYDAVSGTLVCASCNPSGARPTGRQLGASTEAPVWAAATIPGWEDQLHPSHPLSEDGARLFFNSFEPLLASDQNDKADVYEWERAASQQACEQLGAERYVASAAGCLSLISSGQGTSDAEFVDASPSGHDVFFTTDASLLPQDPGLIDIYDAREDGGFQPPTSQEACVGEACQPAAPPPASQMPVTGARGSGNPTHLKPTCGKGRRAVKRHGKWRCVSTHKHRRHGHHRGKRKPGKHGSHRRSAVESPSQRNQESSR